MKMSLYIQSNGILARNANTIQFINEEVKRAVPIAQVRDIHCFGKVTPRSGVIPLLSDKNIPLHFYNKYGMHVSSLMPRKHLISGKVLLKQVEAHTNPEHRAAIAGKMVESTRRNILSLLSNYVERGKISRNELTKIKEVRIPQLDISRIMAAEAQIWKEYYRFFDSICPSLPFVKRSFRPPENEMNALISLANTLLYNSVLSIITQTYLDPTISFLHDTGERRYSLSLDLAEHYKPLIAHKVIFTLVNKKQLKKDSFTKKGGIRLKDDKFQLFLKTFQEAMSSPTPTKQKLTYRTQIKNDCHRLVKHLLGGKKFRLHTE